MTTLKERVLAECEEWGNTDDGRLPIKVHPTGWEIWAVDDHYEFHRHDSQYLYIDLTTDEATDGDYAILAQLLGIGGKSMSAETDKPKAAPIQWRPASGNEIHSVCGVYRIEIHADGCRVFARGQYLGHAVGEIESRQLCRLSRQGEFEILGGWRQDGDLRLWPTKYPTKYDNPWRLTTEELPEEDTAVLGWYDATFDLYGLDAFTPCVYNGGGKWADAIGNVTPPTKWRYILSPE